MDWINKEMRGRLVEGAEAIIADALDKGWLGKETGKSQFSNLSGVCQEATCRQEVELWVRYQVGRDIWEDDFYKALTKSIVDAVKEENYRTRGVEAWRLFSVYLAREFTYRDKLRKKEGARRG